MFLSIPRAIVRPSRLLCLLTTWFVPSTPFIVQHSRPIMPMSTRRSLITTFEATTTVTQRRTLLTAAVDGSPEGATPSRPTKKRKKEQASTPAKKITATVDGTPALKTPAKTPSKTPSKTPAKKKSTTPRRKKEVLEPGSRSPPSDFESIYSLVEELRADRTAPVDDNGSEALPQRDLGEETFRFQVLVALMLSSQTKDAVVGDAMRALQQHGLTVDNISRTPPDVLNKFIAKVGFHNNKTKYIKQAVEVLKEEYNGDIPSTAEDLMKLAGVGPKMAYIVEHVAWGRTSGIGVDTHMHRIFNELKWVTSKNPEKTRIQLESWLPREKWESVNILWVGFGQEVQQFKPKMLEKVLNSSRPMEALKLVKRLGLDYKKEADKAGSTEKLNKVLDANKKIKTEE